MLIRHAKAAQQDGSDDARPLAPRGVADARVIGRWLAEHDLAPDLVVVSPARRAKQTWDAAAADVAAPPPMVVDTRVYDNTVAAVLSVVNETDEAVATLAVVGHNPSMHALTVSLDDGKGDALSRAALADGFPTAGIAVLDVEVDWGALDAGKASLREFGVPRG